MNTSKALKNTLLIATSTALLAVSGMASAARVVKREVVNKPHKHVRVIKRRVCGHNGCVNINKRIKYRPNGMKKITTTRCQHGFCSKQVVVRN